MKTVEIFQASILPAHLMEKINNVPSNAAAKIDHVASIINAINSEAKKLKHMEMELAAQRRSLEFVVEQAESSLKEEMSSEGMVELHGEMIKYSVSPSPHKLIIEDESQIPAEYKIEVLTTQIRKDVIKDELKLGTIIPGAKLEQGVTLKLSANKE